MRHFISLPIFLTLFACGPSSETNDPIRVDFVGACMEMRAYQSMKEEKRNTLCGCTYDTALQGLSKDAQNAARFYLLEQAGGETATLNLVSKPPDMTVMLEASRAIGEAVRQCH